MLEVIEPGLLTTIQDAGRRDALDLGVPISGACDTWSLAVANALVGNDPNEAAIEMNVAGATFRVLEDCLLGFAGADMERSFDRGRGRFVRRGDTIAFGVERGLGVRTYLALAGGIDVPVVLGSRSTCLIGGFGGFEGRPLRAGDIIRSRTGSTWVQHDPRSDGPAMLLGAEEPHTIRVVPGPEPAALDTLLATTWRVGGRGDRQGIRLDGPPLRGSLATMLSRGVTWGSIQVPPDGQPIVLLADHQTVGGYPVVAVVITADRPLIGQLGPADELRFVEVDIPTAQHALRQRAATFGRLVSSIS
jgi:antagonist of KipI